MTPMGEGEARAWRALGIIDSRGGPGRWALRGLCAQTEPDAFFPEKAAEWQGRFAKTICSRCEVMIECLTYAKIADEPHGVWGGKSRKQRNLVPMPTPTSYASGQVAEMISRQARSLAANNGRAQRALEVVRLTLAGLPAREVSTRTGVSTRQITRIMSKHYGSSRAAS